jgi:hypothetical protein
LYATKKEQKYDHGSPTAWNGTVDEEVDYDTYHIKKRKRGESNSHEDAGLQWPCTESQNTGHSQLEHFGE